MSRELQFTPWAERSCPSESGMPILEAYLDNTVERLYHEQMERLILQDPRLSPARAGEIAAAIIAQAYLQEYAWISAKIGSRYFSPDQGALYDEWVAYLDEAAEAPLSYLETLSGSRTIMDDIYLLGTQERGSLMAYLPY